MRRALLVVVAALAGCGGTAEPAPLPAGRAALLEQPGAPEGDGAELLGARPTAQTSARRASGGPAAPLIRARWATARLSGRVALRSSPVGRAVGRIGPRTQFGGPRVVSVLRRRGSWLQVVVPERPNARPAWIPARRALLSGTDVSIRIDRSERTLAVRDRGRVVQRVTIGVGAPGHPTPTGRFAVTDKLKMGGPGTTYGCCAIALSAHQPNLPNTWNGLDRIAVHGTQSPETIGVAASLGCMHASERDLRRLMRAVPLGAPVFIRA
jgi:lipoprotein-anchoring transpeptidase ErfK/SrfK